MADSSGNVSGQLNQWVGDYLSQMTDCGYAPHTIYIHQRLLSHFQKFAKTRKLDRQELFTHDTLTAFVAHCGLLHASWALRGLSRYLFKTGVIPAAIAKPPARLGDIYEAYLQFLKKDRQVGPSTLGSTRRVLSAFCDYPAVRDIALKALRIEHIDDFLKHYNTGLAPATCRHNRSNLRGFLRYLFHRGILTRDLSRLVVGAVNFAHTNPPKFLHPGEIKQLFALPGTYTARELRCLAMVHLAYALGLRPCEISRICLDDIAFAANKIRIPHRKSGNPVLLPLPESAIKAVAAYIVGARPKSRFRELFLTLFVPFRPVTAATVSRDITARVRKVRPDATAYWLRHTYAQHLLESSASIFDVKQMMGHDAIQSTRRYLHIHTSLMRKVLFDENL